MNPRIPELDAAGINGEVLLDAIPCVEVSNMRGGLRVEPAYLPAGYGVAVQGRPYVGTGAMYRAEVIEAHKAWGWFSACSFSRWQFLACNAWRLGYRGEVSALDRDVVALPYVVLLLREHVARITKAGVPLTVEAIAEAWNTGSASDRFSNPEYQRKVREAYDALLKRRS